MIFFSYYSLTALLSVTQVWILSGFLLSLRGKSAPTWRMGIAYVSLGFFSLGYLWAYSIFDPSAAFHRIITVLFVMTSLMYFIYFGYSFGKDAFPREHLVMKFLLPVIVALNTAYFIWTVGSAEPFFSFNGHFYNFNAGTITARMIQLFFLWFVVVSLRKAFKLKGPTGRAMLYFALAVIFITAAPSVTNRMSLEGKISRNIHQTLFSITTVVGYFGILVIYINNTRDRTTFMFKILGITISVVLLIILFMSMVLLPMREDSFNDRSRLLAREAVETGRREKEISYIARLNPGEKAEYAYKRERVHLTAENLTPDKITCRVPGLPLADGGRKDWRAAHANRTGADTVDPVSGRVWRCGSEKNPVEKYVAFQLKNSAGDLYEIGLAYELYREHMHHTARWFVLITGLLVVFLLTGFPLFFRINLVNPLGVLLRGVEEVNNKNLDVEIPVHVQDEIGFLSKSFNDMVTSIRLAHRKLEDYATTLEDKVKERTRELVDKMRQIESLKVQQDGDYFLTSLISKPLATNWNRSENVTTVIYQEQKKKFIFRERHAEIGGDICITGNLKFGPKAESWIMFANGDAMGKSMQGAGGAIVLGTSLNNIMARSAGNGRVLTDVTPEEWLSNTYHELDNVFKTFDGSMMTSVVMGLIHEETGRMVYFNAEHPWMALYRDGKADFIEKELLLRKLGSYSEFTFVVREFQLYPGDIVICGSDGRDDLLLGYDARGDRIINEDERVFLGIVEKSRGSLETIVENIHNTGGVTDDLSLIRVGFQTTTEIPRDVAADGSQADNLYEKAYVAHDKGREEQAIHFLEQALALDGLHSDSLHLLAQILYRQKKDYVAAIPLMEKYVQLNPKAANFWFYLSVCYKHLRRYEDSRDAGERVRTFQPHRVANLINLADNYRLLGMADRAREVLEEVIRMEPNKESALKLLEMLKQDIQTATS